MTDHDTIVNELAQIVGATHVSSAPADVSAYGGLEPLLVVWPGAAAEVARVLERCTALGVAVGVSACGTRATRHWPVQDDRPRVALDTRRMLNILEVDELSLTVNTQCGIQLRHLEQALNRHGLTLGPYPPQILRHTLGGLLAAPHPMAYSALSGWLSAACMAVSVAQPDGSVIHTRVAPRRATGPDLARMYLGSRGALGVVTTAVLRVHRQHEHEAVVAYMMPSLADAAEAGRRALSRGVRPARLTLLGAEQALTELGETDPPLPAVMLGVLMGPHPLVETSLKLLDEVALDAGATPLPQAVGSRWWARASSYTETPEPAPFAVPARVRHSRVAAALAAVPARIKRKRVLSWADQLSPQGVTLWFALEGVFEESAALRSALLDAGLDPLRPNFPPLFVALRSKLDPQETLVVMEA